LISQPDSRQVCYEGILADYLCLAEEGALLRVYELGRDMFEHDLGVLDAVGVHNRAVQALAANGTAISGESLTRAGEALSELLGAFEMVLRGFREANTGLRELSARLESEVDDRTKQLRTSLDALDSEKLQLESTQGALVKMVEDLKVERRRVADTNVELRKVNDAMGCFIATAAHNMRSPLASIVGFSSLLTKSWAMLNDENRLKFVTTIDRQSHKLSALVNDLLTLSSIDGGVLNTRPELIDLSDAIHQCLAESSLDTSNVSVSCAPDLVVYCDQVHLGRILDNYLENAFKYGEAPVRIEASPADDMVEIRVVDHGTGVPPDFEPKLYGKFARADIPSMRHQKGTGLGLSIVRGLAQANGGQAQYQRNIPHGSCFTLLLPKEERSAALISGTDVGRSLAGQQKAPHPGEPDEGLAESVRREGIEPATR
jgi:signal transduction histidine kinase